MNGVSEHELGCEGVTSSLGFSGLFSRIWQITSKSLHAHVSLQEKFAEIVRGRDLRRKVVPSHEEISDLIEILLVVAGGATFIVIEMPKSSVDPSGRISRPLHRELSGIVINVIALVAPGERSKGPREVGSSQTSD
jgi:hypothetical protein